LQKISVPALNVTSCAFGGKDLDILYITSASMSMNESQKEQYPHAGKLFQVKPGVKGIKANYFKTR
jgi:sugar lactone lactonase YvrE